MNIRKCGKRKSDVKKCKYVFITAREYLVPTLRRGGDESAINSSRNKILRGLPRMYFILLYTVYCTLLTVSAHAETMYAAGRGTEEKGTVWAGNTIGKWSIHSTISKCSEIFCITADNNGNLVAGGNYFNYGKIWRYDGKTWDDGLTVPECRGMYALTVDKKGNLWAGGSGDKNVWMFDGKKWNDGVKLNGCSIIYTMMADSAGGIWAGGEGKNQVWYFNGEKWDDGIKLSDCDNIFSLFADKSGTVWAGGNGGKVLWWHKEGKWSSGIILLDSTEISAFAEDTNGQVYACGAGRNKIWIRKTDADWSGVDLKECIAVYSIVAYNKGIYTGGWNVGRRGRVWKANDTQPDKWDNGEDIEKCYVIRALTSVKSQ